ncbi:MAG: NADH-quinone oxidoreductase subunit N [Planctomycetales bacterium]|nr:NADH-quinone oxidoreductase subunit N [Planctomycetales bacterium]
MGSFHGLIDALLTDTLGGEHAPGSLSLFRPELMLCATIVVSLFVKVFNSGQRISGFLLALVGTLAALYFATVDAGRLLDGHVARQEIFTGLLVFDSFTIFFRWLLLVFAVLFFVPTRITRIFDRNDATDIYAVVLGAILGMCLMASANHLLAVFLAVEMASVPSYVLAGILRTRKSSEASLKYAIYGAGAAGVMLYGISLLAGVTGSAHLPTIARQLVAMSAAGEFSAVASSGAVSVLAVAGLMIAVGLAFKLSAVPFHFWCPDVFEGATAEVNAFLSVASKAAALALLVRVTLGVGMSSESAIVVQQQTPATVASTSLTSSVAATSTHVESVAAAESVAPTSGDANRALAPVRGFIIKLLALLAVLTCTFGNLAAYGQTNIKRLLAYSTIAHAGYMMMPVCATLALVSNAELANEAVSALTFYITLYLFMNLGAFAVVAFLRNAIGSEEIEDYAGLVRTQPVTIICFALMLFSLIGLPPFAGFVGKLAIFKALIAAGGPVMYTLLVVAGLNTAISLVYYLRVVKVMTIDPEPDTRSPVTMGFLPAVYTVALAAPIVVFGIGFDQLYRFVRVAAEHLFV